MAIKYGHMSVDKFMNYLQLLSERVEKKTLHPDSFAFVFDRWSVEATHNVATYESFAALSSNCFTQRLLSFSPFMDDEKGHC